MARFELRPTLPTAVWLRLGGLRLGNLDFTPVDWALESLRSPTTVEDRLGVLQQQVDFWHGPIKLEDRMSEAELAGGPLPRPLRWWYGWAEKRTEIMSQENDFSTRGTNVTSTGSSPRGPSLLLRGEPGRVPVVHAVARR
jgi:hypothetical protein